jgi:hypothetical protein
METYGKSLKEEAADKVEYKNQPSVQIFIKEEKTEELETKRQSQDHVDR